MRATVIQVRSFNRPIQLLLINQLTINTGFYMLMPYLASHLSGDLGLAAWLTGLILGVRNFSQQGMFLIGGTLADRIGYKPMILAGLVLRTAGFALLGFADSVVVLLVASALTGLAGALFNPAVRAYLAAEAGDRKVEAFAVFNVFYQTGILVGPLIGLALGGVAFQLTCSVAAALFAILAVAQARALPGRRGGAARSTTFLQDWRQAIANRTFLLFSIAMTGSYVLNFQVYLALPLEVRRMTGGEAGVMLLFALSGGLAVFGQIHVTAWAKARWSSQQAIARGLALMGLAFVPPALGAVASPMGTSPAPWYDRLPDYALALGPVLVATALLTLAVMIVYPFEMATITTLGGSQMTGTYYGLYSTLTGIGIAAGNLLSGLALDTGRDLGVPGLAWWAFTALGLGCALAVGRSARLRSRREAVAA